MDPESSAPAPEPFVLLITNPLARVIDLAMENPVTSKIPFALLTVTPLDVPRLSELLSWRMPVLTLVAPV